MRDRARTKKKSWAPINFRTRRQLAPQRENIDDNSNIPWIPELFGPVFANDKISLRQALHTHVTDRRTRTMATFVPDELIYALDLTKKNFREFIVVLLLVDMSAFNSLWERFSCAENNGSNGFSCVLNFYMSHMVENIYSSEGDIINVSAGEVLAMWKVRKEEFIARTMDIVIRRALHLKDVLESFGIGSKSLPKVKMAISSGLVICSVIGNETARDFVILGNSVVEIRKSKETCAPGDVVVTESAWEHVSQEHYEYVFRDAHSIKIVRSLEHSSREKPEADTSLACDKFSLERISTTNSRNIKNELLIPIKKNPNFDRLKPSMEESELERKIFTGRFSMAEAMRRKLGTHLRTFTIDPVLLQIEKDLPLEHLTETRRVTVAVVNLEPIKGSVYELLSLIDECYILLYSIVAEHFGCVNVLVVNDRAIQFFVVFGLRSSENRDDCKNGILCAAKSMIALKCISGIRGASVGISTGMIYCGVIGHPARMNYVTFGSPIDKANRIACISNDKICCEFDTVFYSNLPRKKFRSRGMKVLKGSGKSHLYEFIDDKLIFTRGKGEGPENFTNLDHVYPILGRFRELDIFTDILDDICASCRNYCGFLIEGPGGIGKSRLLDELVRIVKSRQICAFKLCLDESNASKPYATIHRILMQLLEAKDNETMEERERALTRKLCDVVSLEDFCYTNIVSRVAFPLSSNYLAESEETRLKKSIIIFDAIIRSLRGPKCIILDDAQFMDPISWKFISRLMNDNRIVVAMSIRPITITNIEFPEPTNFANDKRIFRHKLQGLEPDYSGALASQLLNVSAIPRELDEILKSRSINHPGWCEAFLTLMLQNKSLRVLSVTPEEVSRNDLIYPHPSLITKISKDLSPDDTTPEFPWNRDRRNAMVCLTSDKFTGHADSFLDINEIFREIYDRSTTYEQNLLQCAATLGNVFTRIMLENIITNPNALDTARAVTRMIDMRILECASIQRRDLNDNDASPCVYKNRATFSDMHHLARCICPQSDDAIPGKDGVEYSHCRLLEFKCNDFRKFMDTRVTLSRRNEYNSKIVEIYERDARKCFACGGGPFIRISEREKPITIKTSQGLRTRRRISPDDFPRAKHKRRSFLSISNDEFREKPNKMEAQRISIMPTYVDSDEESASSLEAEKIVTFVGKIYAPNGENESAKFRKRTPTSCLAIENDPSRISHLRNFNHIDYRNCQCNGIVDCLFWKIYQHLQSIGNFEKLVRFMIDYSAGLIQTGQSFQATKLLTSTHEKIESSSFDIRYIRKSGEDRRINEGALLALMGDASKNLGDYGRAKRHYSEALRLCVNFNCNLKKFCLSYRIFDQACKQKLRQTFPGLFVNRASEYDVATKLRAATYLARLSAILLWQKFMKQRSGENSTSKLAALESINVGFSCSGSFIEKCDIYVRIARIFRNFDDLSFARKLEKSMMHTIRRKQRWTDAEEVAAVAIVFKSMFEIRLLRGEYEDALIMGSKVLKISTGLKMSRTKLTILPQLIQLTIRTKRIHETVDLMRILHHSAPEDIDESSVTWYYALSLDLALDAGMILESFENCYDYANRTIARSKSGACVSRDPDSLRRLLTCLWLWELRMSVPSTFAQSLESYTRDTRADNFCHVMTIAKALECYLLKLRRCINMKRADQLVQLLDDIDRVTKILEKISKTSLFIKPRFYVLKAYMKIVRGRKLAAMRYLRKASGLAMDQANPMMLAWIRQNERTWRLKRYNNMAHYWVEHVGFNDACDWQNMHFFDIKTWSSTLFPIPIPDTCL